MTSPQPEGGLRPDEEGSGLDGNQGDSDRESSQPREVLEWGAEESADLDFAK